VPDDIKRAALPVLRHRVVLSPELAVEGVSADVILDDLVESVPAPTN
jgi:MoxR-like ATPase